MLKNKSWASLVRQRTRRHHAALLSVPVEVHFATVGVVTAAAQDCGRDPPFRPGMLIDIYIYIYIYTSIFNCICRCSRVGLPIFYLRLFRRVDGNVQAPAAPHL